LNQIKYLVRIAKEAFVAVLTCHHGIRLEVLEKIKETSVRITRPNRIASQCETSAYLEALQFPVGDAFHFWSRRSIYVHTCNALPGRNQIESEHSKW
jgi:hypothetical protein